MAGGTWTTQNKVRPGVYINFKSQAQALGTLGERGVAAFPAPLPWGDPENVIVLEAAEYADKALELIGFRAEDARIRHITAAMSHASKVLLYRLGGTGAVKAKVTVGALMATAKWGGTRGNDLQVVVQANIDNVSAFDVKTLLDGEVLDTQTVTTIADMAANKFIDWSGTGALTASAGASLIGGTDGTASGADFSAALTAFEGKDYNVLGVPLTDSTSKQLAVAYIRRQREDEGKKVAAVLVSYPAADNEGVTSLKNGIITSDGLQVSPEMLLWEVAAMAAAAEVNESLTYRAIPNAVDAFPRLTNTETIAALNNGELVISAANGQAVIEQDINTFKSLTPDKGKAFRKNRVVRVLDSIANDMKRTFDNFYIGKIDNNASGRNLLKGEYISYLDTLTGINAIQNFDSQTDLIVAAGSEADAVLIDLYIQPVDSIEKIYMNVEVK
ncbi:Phage tail sheath protein [Paenibacillus algorifonticola]|uniref:Phage tail sheath protein n=1 Tax=Paenibacillus algorifonticola TaxID=684063 RepID=A0A1I2H2B8_9BACL|nr:phage tail sheath family protein [Paenibacillus algorifonticola]SFF23117.1 Phage tail sheath protein [Paenibacillus algorifonticola]